MDADLETLAAKVDRLADQNRKLGIATYAIWPGVWAVTLGLSVIPGKLDAGAMEVLLTWSGVALAVVVVCLILWTIFWFFLRLATDFGNRKSRFALNPGSRAR